MSFRAIVLIMFFSAVSGNCLADDTHFSGDTAIVVAHADTTAKSVGKQKVVKWDTTRNDGYWRRALMHGKFNPYDTTIKYPRFLDFCLRVYRWGDKTFNSYDTAYVTPTGKNWKVMVKNNNWLDAYSGRLANKQMRVFVSSPMNTVVGAQISFMAVSYAYMFDIDNLVGGDKTMHKKWDFSFTCARFSVEAYKSSNTGKTRIHHMGNYNSGRFFSEDFTGLERESSGLDIFYIFNHRKYSQAAAYCYSKIQRRSAGSFIAGILISNQDVKIDFSKLENEEMKAVIPKRYNHQPMDKFRFQYREWNLIAGYAYNWVLKRNWLLNITALPSVGFKHCSANSTDGKRDLFSLNIRGKVGIVRNKGNFFYAGQFCFDGHLYNSRTNRFFNSVEEFNITAGFRF